MMNKKLLVGCAAVALSTVTLAANSAFAEEAKNVDSATQMNTDASIGFYSDNKPGPGPFQDNLALAYVPAAFNFGNHNITGVKGALTYQQVTPAKTQYLAVSDDRAEKANWNVSATLDQFTSTTTPADGSAAPTLASAELSMDLGKAQEYNINIADSDAGKAASPAPTAAGAVTDFASGDLKGTYALGKGNSTVTLTANGTSSVEVLSYTKGATADKKTLAVATAISNVKLKVKDVDKVSADQSYKSTVRWNLSDTATDPVQ